VLANVKMHFIHRQNRSTTRKDTGIFTSTTAVVTVLLLLLLLAVVVVVVAVVVILLLLVVVVVVVTVFKYTSIEIKTSFKCGLCLYTSDFPLS
jgi:Flp pilus assembly protein TadB